MVIDSLTQQMQEEGAILTKALDKTELHPTSALWFYFPDIHRWRYVFASTAVDKVGPRKVYRRVRTVIAKAKKQLATLDLTDVAAVSVKHPLVQLLGDLTPLDGRF